MARHPDSSPGAPAAGAPSTVFDAVPASTRCNILAEGPVWVAATGTVMWIDVEAGRVFGGQLAVDRAGADRITESWILEFDSRVGAAVPGVDGSILVAASDRLVIVAPSGERVDGPALVWPGTRSRSNDGACDPGGRFLVGTMALDDREGAESLYRVEDDGSLTTIDSDLTLSNGLGWSPDGRVLYSTDTIPGVIWARDYDPVTGVPGPRREHLRLPGELPDGLCVDSRGYLWVALWGRGEVRSFSPDGSVAATVRVPCPHPSSVAFVGEDLDILLITTASRDLSAAELVEYPDAGRLFLARVGTTGTPTFAWSASWRGSQTDEA